MKKVLLFAVLCFPIFCYSQGEDEKEPIDTILRYVLPYGRDTVFGEKLLLSQYRVKLKNDKKVLKWDKTEVSDYGYINQKKQSISTFHLSAFPVKTYPSLALTGLDLDTVPCYIEQWFGHTKSLKGYYPNHKEFSVNTTNTKSFKVENWQGKEVWYDAIRLTLDSYQVIDEGETSYINIGINQFAERLSDGKIRLNKARVINRATYRGDEEAYLLKKDFKTYTIYIETGLLTINALELLSELMSDYPELVQKINDKGYHYQHIPTIIEEYNAYFK